MQVIKIKLITGEVLECDYPDEETMFADMESQGKGVLAYWVPVGQF